MPRQRRGDHALAGSEAGRQRARRLLSRAALVCGAAAAGWLLFGVSSPSASAAPAGSIGSDANPAPAETMDAPVAGASARPGLLGSTLSRVESSLGLSDKNSSPTAASHLSSLSQSNLIGSKLPAVRDDSTHHTVIISCAKNDSKSRKESNDPAVDATDRPAGNASSGPIIGSGAAPVRPSAAEQPRGAAAQPTTGVEHAAESSAGSALPLPLVDQLLDPADPLGSVTAPILDPVTAALAPVTTVAEPLVAPLAAVTAPITAPADTLVSDVTHSIAPVTTPLASAIAPLTHRVGEALAPVTQTVQSATESATPALDAVEPLIADVSQAVDPVGTALHPLMQTVSDDAIAPATGLADPVVSRIAEDTALPASQLLTTNLAGNQSALTPISASLTGGLSAIADNQSVISFSATPSTLVFLQPIPAQQQRTPETSVTFIGLGSTPAPLAELQPVTANQHSGIAAQIAQPKSSAVPLAAPVAMAHAAVATNSPNQSRSDLPVPQPAPVGGAGGTGTSNTTGNTGSGPSGASAADVADSWAAAPIGSEARDLDNVSSPKNDGKKPPVSPA